MSRLSARIRDRLWIARIEKPAKPRKGRRRHYMIPLPALKSMGSLRSYLEKPRPGVRRR